MKSKIAQALVKRSPAPERGRSALYADTEMRGFHLALAALVAAIQHRCDPFPELEAAVA